MKVVEIYPNTGHMLQTMPNIYSAPTHPTTLATVVHIYCISCVSALTDLGHEVGMSAT